MEDTILHSGALTVSIDGTVAVAGKLPTLDSLDDIARVRAYRRYMASCDDLSDWRDDRDQD